MGSFQTEGSDRLRIDGHSYSGRGASRGPTNVAVHPGSKINWYVDGGGEDTGWKVCSSDGTKTGGCICKQNYDVSKKCAVCNPRYDPKQDCAVCIKPGYDKSAACRVCKPGFDTSKDCAVCKKTGYDPAKDCKVCKTNLWGNDCDQVRSV